MDVIKDSYGFVCTSCGNVLEDRIIDDRIIYTNKNYNNNNNLHFFNVKENELKYKNIDSIVLQWIRDVFRKVFDEKVGDEISFSLIQYIEDNTRMNHKEIYNCVCDTLIQNCLKYKIECKIEDLIGKPCFFL